MPYRSMGSRRIVSALALLCFCSFLTVATQSGRRAVKKPPEPVATPEPSPEMTSESGRPPERPKPALSLILGMDRSQSFGNFRNIQIILTAVAERFESNRTVELRQVLDDFERGEAVERAKKEPEAYVVLLEFRSTRASGNSGDFSIQYWVFSPNTGKLKASGQTYPEDTRTRGILSPRAPTIYGDYQLQNAAMDVADRVLAVFKLKAHGPLG